MRTTWQDYYDIALSTYEDTEKFLSGFLDGIKQIDFNHTPRYNVIADMESEVPLCYPWRWFTGEVEIDDDGAEPYNAGFQYGSTLEGRKEERQWREFQKSIAANKNPSDSESKAQKTAAAQGAEETKDSAKEDQPRRSRPGRPTIGKEKMVLMSLYVTREQREKVKKLGGSAWIRLQIDSAEPDN